MFIKVANSHKICNCWTICITDFAKIEIMVVQNIQTLKNKEKNVDSAGNMWYTKQAVTLNVTKTWRNNVLSDFSKKIKKSTWQTISVVLQ